MRLKLIAIAVTVLLSGCARVGTYVEPESATGLSTTKTSADLMQAIGPPSVTVPMGNGKTMWVYIGQLKTPSWDQFIPYVGIVTGRENQKCSKLTVLVDDSTGELSDMKYEATKDTDYWANTDESCTKR